MERRQPDPPSQHPRVTGGLDSARAGTHALFRLYGPHDLMNRVRDLLVKIRVAELPAYGTSVLE